MSKTKPMSGNDLAALREHLDRWPDVQSIPNANVMALLARLDAITAERDQLVGDLNTECIEHIAGIDAMDAVVDERDRLREELIEWILDYFHTNAHEEKDGPMAGWWDTMAMSSVLNAGDKLVELGLYERHPDGVGRRWFFRSKKAALAQKGGE